MLGLQSPDSRQKTIQLLKKEFLLFNFCIISFKDSYNQIWFSIGVVFIRYNGLDTWKINAVKRKYEGNAQCIDFISDFWKAALHFIKEKFCYNLYFNTRVTTWRVSTIMSSNLRWTIMVDRSVWTWSF